MHVLVKKTSILYLNCGKFRIMASGNAFIPKYSPNLINFLKPSNLHFFFSSTKFVNKYKIAKQYTVRKKLCYGKINMA